MNDYYDPRLKQARLEPAVASLWKEVSIQKRGGGLNPSRHIQYRKLPKEDEMRVIKILEKTTSRKALVKAHPMQPGDLQETFADISPIKRDHGFEPRIPIETGIPRFVSWLNRTVRFVSILGPQS